MCEHCGCDKQKTGPTPRPGINTWGCGCHEMMPEPKSKPKGVVKFCDLCNPCNRKVPTVRLCAFVVPTLEDGRYYRDSFVFVQEDDSTYYIGDDRTEIPFGSRPKFIDDFDPTDPTIKYKRTVVYDVKNKKQYVYGEDGTYMTINGE